MPSRSRSLLCLSPISIIVSMASLCSAVEPIKPGDAFLTIGNSLSLAKDDAIPGLLNALFQSQGKQPVEWGRLSKWARGLRSHHETPSYLTAVHKRLDSAGSVDPKLGAYANILSGPAGKSTKPDRRWDFVSLQGFGSDDTEPAADDAAEDPKVFNAYVRKFDMVIRKRGGQTVLFARYDNKTKDDSDAEIARYKSTSDRLMKNYDAIGKELGAIVVPVAEVMKQAMLARPAGTSANYLYTPRDNDQIHPGPLAKGVYAYTFYAALTGQSPVGLALKHADYDDTDPATKPIDEILERVSWDVVKARTDHARAGSANDARSGDVVIDYDPASGKATITVTGKVMSIRLGTPGQHKMKPGSAPKLGTAPAIQSDDELAAWYDASGLAAGTYELAGLVAPGTPASDVLLCFTPVTGDAANVTPK